MKLFALVVGLISLLTASGAAGQQELQPGNWDIRVEPTAKLQTGAPIPFQITVRDSLQKPVVEAKVTLQIETADHQKTRVFKAAEIDRGVYIAKAMFPTAGQWDVLVEVHRDNKESARTLDYIVPQ